MWNPVQSVLKIGQYYNNKITEAREGKGITSTSSLFGIEESEEITTRSMLNILNKDGTANFVVTATVNAAVGLGYHYKANPGAEGAEQVRILEEWNNSKDVMMRGKNIEIGRNMYGMGFSPTELVDLNFLVKIPSLPMEADWKWTREPSGGEITSYIEWLGGQRVEFKPDEIVPFTMNVSADHPIGRGVLQQLAETENITLTYSNSSTKQKVKRFSMYRARSLITADLVKLIHNGVPKSLWKLRIKDSKMKDASQQVETLEPGQRMLTNASDIDIKSESSDVRVGHSQVLGDFDDLYAVALMSFLPKFFSKTPWTESSSLTAERIWYNALVQNFQETFREQKVIRIDDLILKQHGFDFNETNYVWGMPQPPRLEQNLIIGVMAQITSAFSAGYVESDFARLAFGQLLDALGDAGLTINTPISSTEQLRTIGTEMSQKMLDGDVSFDKRKLAEQYLNQLDKYNKVLKQNPGRKIA